MVELQRCPWVDLRKPLYVVYHDTEWGVPVHDDRRMFELLVLEGAQAGLSWYTVLSKRENYRRAFDGFDPVKMAAWDEAKIESLLRDPGIIRNRLKIQSAITNAQAYLQTRQEFGSLDAYIWQFAPPPGPRPRTLSDVPASTPESDAMSKALKKRGFRFVGSTICYAFMQSAGLVDDHVEDCWVPPVPRTIH